ncbi:MAG: hypothetical protein R3A13_09905 [Bdellovibrionota bacterium]
MALIDVPRIILTGYSGVNKVVNIAMGLVHELRSQGKSVVCSSVTPNLKVIPTIERLSSRPVSCIHPEILSQSRIAAMTSMAVSGADFLIIIGACDLLELNSLDQKIIEAVNCPTITVTRSLHRKPFDPRIKIDATILLQDNPQEVKLNNSVLGTFDLDEINAHEPLIEHYLEPAPNFTRKEILRISELVRSKLNISAIEIMAEKAEKVDVKKFTFTPSRRKTNIAVARDGCFSGGFSDNLILLRYFGANLIEFSPISDKNLPADIGGVYLPACFIGEYGQALSDNQEIKADIIRFARTGGVIYSEGPASGYLCNKFKLGSDGDSFSGVGLVPGRAYLSDTSPKQVEFLVREDCILGYPGLVLQGLWTKSWSILEQEQLVNVLEVNRNRSETYLEGFSPGAQIVSTLGMLHFGSCREVANNLVLSAQVVKNLDK